jgi:hypothetical protein
MSTDAIEAQARTMGWMPKENYLRDKVGPEENWLPADKYVERGQSIMPILKANNRKLADQVNQQGRELNETKAALAAATEAIEELKAFSSTVNKEKVKGQKTEIMAQLAQAKKDGDVEAEVQLTDKLSEVNAAIKEAGKPALKPEPKPNGDGPTLTPESRQWMSDNPWFGTDHVKTGTAMGLSNAWKAAGKTLGTKEFFDHVDEEMAKLYDRNAERRERGSKVDSTNNSGGGDGGGNSKGKTYADLPDEAKRACEKSAERLVGPNRAYKTKAEWQKRYVELYDWS